MRFTKWDYIAFPFLAALGIGVFYGAIRLVGYFGLGVLPPGDNATKRVPK